jgi:hypothetical protein
MRVVYHGFGKPHKASIVSSLYHNYNWIPICLIDVYRNTISDLHNFLLKDCLVFDPMNLRRAQFDYSDIGEAVPIDEKILEKLSKYEATYMNLLGSFQDPTGWLFSHSERKNYYIDILTFWNTLIHNRRPDLIVFYTWPHTPSCYSLYLICKHVYKINILFIDPNPLLDSNYHMINNSVEELSKPLAINGKIKSLDGSNMLDISQLEINQNPKHISSDFQKYEKSETNIKRLNDFIQTKIRYLSINRVYNYVKGNGIDWKANTRPYFSKNSRMNTVQLFVFFEKLKYKNRRLKRYYSSKSTIPKLNSNFIYFSAPYQPEATSYLGGGSYENTLLALRLLSYYCPKGWNILYKEHPATFFDKFRGSLKRDAHYYEKIFKLKNIQLVPSDFDQFALIRNSKAVAVISGTAAWEGVIRKKPVISFGQGWYSECKGIMRVSSSQDLIDSIEKIVNSVQPHDEDVNNYVSVIKQVAFQFPEHYSKKEFSISRAEEVAGELYKAYLKFYNNQKR